MKRYPPIARPGASILHQIVNINVPYAELYRKVKERNPIFTGEALYGAFANTDPAGLILAKKQYKYMREGLSEDAAYQKALEYVNELEDNAYQQLKQAVDAAKKEGARATFVGDPSVAVDLAFWQAKILETPYDELELEEQGELDYFLQSKILKWNEAERERRMKEPLFVLQFEQLLESLFPISAEKYALKQKNLRKKFKDMVYSSVDDEGGAHLNTTKPFFIEDYLHYLKLIQIQPDLIQWGHKQREEFSCWIVDTLAYGSALVNKDRQEVQEYLDELRERFFPLLRLPFLAYTLQVPSAEDVKRALYNSEVGYKRQEGKTFVKRFYRLPHLLFPLEHLAAQLAPQADTLLGDEQQDRLQSVLKECGLGSSAELERMREVLRQYQRNAATLPQEQPEEVGMASDLSVLDEILRDSQGTEEHKKDIQQAVKAPREEPVQFVSSSPALPTVAPGTPEWVAMVSKYIRIPQTSLEKDRFAFYGQLDFSPDLEQIDTEHAAEEFQQSRMQSEILAQARLGRKYEVKESARRKREWERRGVWTNELPSPVAPLVPA